MIGFSHIVPGEIVALFISPQCARKGIGTTLMKHAMPIARQDWEGPIRLEATLNAVLFYESLGFKRIRELMAQRNNTAIPVVEMESNSS